MSIRFLEAVACLVTLPPSLSPFTSFPFSPPPVTATIDLLLEGNIPDDRLRQRAGDKQVNGT